MLQMLLSSVRIILGVEEVWEGVRGGGKGVEGE